jgi:hypothetical protein
MIDNPNRIVPGLPEEKNLRPMTGSQLNRHLLAQPQQTVLSCRTPLVGACGLSQRYAT